MGRGRSQHSLDIIEAMYEIAKESEPITGRGVGYKLFSLNLIPFMGRNDMQVVYRLLKEAREEGAIPWAWIVDETRELEQVATWDNATEYLRCTARDYRRDFWQQQPERIQVWSEKGTVRGTLRPLLDEYGVGFNPVHGFSSATTIHDVCDYDDGRPLTILYVGDFDPSGMYMSERDIPERLQRYDGNHVSLKRIALLRADCDRLGRRPAFNVKDRARTRAPPGFEKTMDSCAGSLTRWTLTTFASVSRRKSKSISSRWRGSAAALWTQQNANPCRTFWASGGSREYQKSRPSRSS